MEKGEFEDEDESENEGGRETAQDFGKNMLHGGARLLYFAPRFHNGGGIVS